ncbi:DUF5005 domain-containing protein [Streptomyces sp. MAR4 CNY-716]
MLKRSRVILLLTSLTLLLYSATAVAQEDQRNVRVTKVVATGVNGEPLSTDKENTHVPERAAPPKESEEQLQRRTDQLASSPPEDDAAPLAEDISTCKKADYGENSQVTLNHWKWCQKGGVYVLSLLCRQGGTDCTQLGRVNFDAILMGTGDKGPNVTDRSMRAWLQLSNPDIIGAPRMTDVVSIRAKCRNFTAGTSCQQNGDNGESQTLQQWVGTTGTGSSAFFDFTSPEGSLTGEKKALHDFSLEIKMPGNPAPWDSSTMGGTGFRCDSATYVGSNHACVFDQVTEVFQLTADGDVKQSADLIWTAQNKPNKTLPVHHGNKEIPGSPASHNSLSRIHDDLKKQNNNESVKQCKKYWGDGYSKGQTKDCDEYPFQSTHQGALTGGTGTKHFAVKAIKKEHNRLAGSRLGAFYINQRILFDDRFYVDLRNTSGGKYQGPDNPNGIAEPVTYHQCKVGGFPKATDVKKQAFPEQKFLDYAASTPNGWTGGDSTYSLTLPDGRRLWQFSDTFLGPLNADGTRPTSAKLVNSTFVTEAGGQLDTITGGTASNPTAIMPPTENRFWYWLGDSTIANVDGTQRLQVIFHEWYKFGDGNWDFRFNRAVVAVFDLDNLKKPLYIDQLPSDSGVQWGSAVLPSSRTEDGYTYIYGVNDAPTDKKMRIARVKGSDLSNDWQYFNGVFGNWMKGETEATDWTNGVSNEYSVTPWRGDYVLISQDSREAFSNKIRIAHGCDPYGPFTYRLGDEDVIYEMPETGIFGDYLDPWVFAYNAHAHPTLQSGDKWTLSYNVNHFDTTVAPGGAHYRAPSIYKPRFVSFTLTEGNRSAAISQPGQPPPPEASRQSPPSAEEVIGPPESCSAPCMGIPR